jgi:hypothetical protein
MKLLLSEAFDLVPPFLDRHCRLSANPQFVNLQDQWGHIITKPSNAGHLIDDILCSDNASLHYCHQQQKLPSPNKK